MASKGRRCLRAARRAALALSSGARCTWTLVWREHNIDEVRGASESWRPTEEWRRSQLFVRQRVGDSAKPHAARVGLARRRRYFYVPRHCCAAASIGSSYDGVPYSLVRGRCGKKREESGWCQGSDGLTPMLYADPRRWSTPRARPKRQADPPTFACARNALLSRHHGVPSKRQWHPRRASSLGVHTKYAASGLPISSRTIVLP